jgi:Transposase DDE domain
VPGAAALIAQRCRAHDYGDPGKPAIAWDDQAARDALVSALVADATAVLDALAVAELDEKAAQAVALIAGQDVEPAEGSDGTDGRWRIARKVAADRVVSTVDPDSRHAHKSRHQRQDGYKAHVAVEPGTGLFTGGKLTRASGEDNHEAEAVVGVELLGGEDAGLTVLGDAAYGSGPARAGLAAAGHTAVIRPAPHRLIAPGFRMADGIKVLAGAPANGLGTAASCQRSGVGAADY